MKRLVLLIAVALSVTMSFAAKNQKKAQQPLTLSSSVTTRPSLSKLGRLSLLRPLKPMNEFVSELMGKMTVQEKIGQLNLLPSGDIQTGI